ncbi:MAG TPA: hypothetical protein VFL55_05765 [Acetobacteraceae bacterium]|nr:hypothetical protein [Acetobacteraceae bacterium]
MGQLIEFPAVAAAYPSLAARLERPECVLLAAIRWWVMDHIRGTDPLARLCRSMDTLGAHAAAFSIDRLMSVVARTVLRPIEIHCPLCGAVSEDEKHLLRAASLAQSGPGVIVERALRTALLSAQGAEFALGPLEGLGELFGRAGLLFRRRLAAPCCPEHAECVGAWAPD